MNPTIPCVQWCFQHNTTQPVVFMKHFSPSLHLPLGCAIHLMQALPRPAPPTLTLSSRWLYRCTLRMWFRTGSFQSSTMLWVTTAGSSTRWREGRGRRGGRGEMVKQSVHTSILAGHRTHLGCKNASLQHDCVIIVQELTRVWHVAPSHHRPEHNTEGTTRLTLPQQTWNTHTQSDCTSSCMIATQTPPWWLPRQPCLYYI